MQKVFLFIPEFLTAAGATAIAEAKDIFIIIGVRLAYAAAEYCVKRHFKAKKEDN